MSTKRIKRKSKQTARYIPLADIKKIDDEFLTEINNVRVKLSGCDDAKLIGVFNEVLMTGYKAAIELQVLEREVDYDNKFSEIEARANELRAWRRCWLWRLLFLPLTNRAQDIIEACAELEADKLHTAAEKAIEDERKKLSEEFAEIKSKSRRERKQELKKQLKAAIRKADETPTNEAFEEPQAEPPADVQKPAENGEKQEPDKKDKPTDKTPENVSKPAKQLPGQMTLDDVQPQEQAGANPPKPARRPRPPRSCRR